MSRILVQPPPQIVNSATAFATRSLLLRILRDGICSLRSRAWGEDSTISPSMIDQLILVASLVNDPRPTRLKQLVAQSNGALFLGDSIFDELTRALEPEAEGTPQSGQQLEPPFAASGVVAPTVLPGTRFGHGIPKALNAGFFLVTTVLCLAAIYFAPTNNWAVQYLPWGAAMQLGAVLGQIEFARLKPSDSFVRNLTMTEIIGCSATTEATLLAIVATELSKAKEALAQRDYPSVALCADHLHNLPELISTGLTGEGLATFWNCRGALFPAETAWELRPSLYRALFQSFVRLRWETIPSLLWHQIRHS